jgi:uroporphyrinogen-III synthase
VNLGALAGYTIAVTADRRSEEQAELIERRGGTVLAGPVIRTLPLADEDGLRQATERLIACPPDVLVLCTALGVRGWFSAAESLGLDAALLGALERSEVVVRGPKAAGAALTAGLEVTWQTPGATYAEVVDHLATRPFERPDGSPVRVAVQLDGAESSPLLTVLPDLGYEVLAVPVYQWHLPADRTGAERIVTAVADRSIDAVTFTSAHAVTNFATIARDTGRWEEVCRACQSGMVTVAAVGPVTASRCVAIGLGEPVEPRNARLGAMVQALVVALAARSTVLDLDGTSLLIQGRMVMAGNGDPISLTDRERSVLALLARRPGAVVSKGTLLREVWTGETDDHVVEVTVGRLRRRLGSAGTHIETVMRRGYRLSTT